eukprot:602434-Amorphochlora_amoeboformis.AAC.1
MTAGRCAGTRAMSILLIFASMVAQGSAEEESGTCHSGEDYSGPTNKILFENCLKGSPSTEWVRIFLHISRSWRLGLGLGLGLGCRDSSCACEGRWKEREKERERERGRDDSERVSEEETEERIQEGGDRKRERERNKERRK